MEPFVLLLLQPHFVISYNTQHLLLAMRAFKFFWKNHIPYDICKEWPRRYLNFMQFSYLVISIERSNDKKDKPIMQFRFSSKKPILKIQKNSTFQTMLSGLRMSSTWLLSQTGFVVSFKISLGSLCVLMLLTFIIETKCFLLKTMLPVPPGFLLSKEKRLNEVFL